MDSGDPWNPRPETVNKVMAMLEDAHRVLKPDGIFISISFGQVYELIYSFFLFVCLFFFFFFPLIFFAINLSSYPEIISLTATFQASFIRFSKIYLVC